jgi:hypothetical protein
VARLPIPSAKLYFVGFTYEQETSVVPFRKARYTRLRRVTMCTQQPPASTLLEVHAAPTGALGYTSVCSLHSIAIETHSVYDMTNMDAGVVLLQQGSSRDLELGGDVQACCFARARAACPQ